MPAFRLLCNISKDQIPDDFMTTIASLIVRHIGKPDTYTKFVLVQISPEQLISFGGTRDPCGHAIFENIGPSTKEVNIKLSHELGNYIEESLGIKKDKLYIKFTDLETTHVGFMGTVLSELIKPE